MAQGWIAYGDGVGVPRSGGESPAEDGDPTVGAGRQPRPEIADVGRLTRRAVRSVVRAARAVEAVQAHQVLVDHLGPGSALAAVAEATWPGYEHVNVQAALDAWLAEPGRAHELHGVSTMHDPDLAPMLSESWGHHSPPLMNVSLAALPCGPDGQVRHCVSNGLYLVRAAVAGSAPLALLVLGPDPRFGRPETKVQAVSPEPGVAAAALAELRALALEHNVLRGQVLSFEPDVYGHQRSGPVSFHRRTVVPRTSLVLPEGVLDLLERQVLGVARHRQRLLDAGQHLKRGLLLYGPPGTGKTHTVRYLVGASPGTTVIRLTGAGLALIAEACSVARALAPAMVVVEDVDLIAEDRGFAGPHSLLFQLLNEMDGLADDADVVFVLTTNRADLLEPALAARPGRVDQAVELGLPDTGARRALLELYRGRLKIADDDLDRAAEATEGVTASFLKELMRRAAVVAATASQAGPGAAGAGEGDEVEGVEGGAGRGAGAPVATTERRAGPLAVTSEQLDEALAELLDTRHAMTRRVLGAEPYGGGSLGLGEEPGPGDLPGPGLYPGY